MKILHIITSVNSANGGPIEGVKQLAKVLVAEGQSVHVCSLDAPDAPWVRNFPLTLFALGPGRSNYAYTSALIPWLRENACKYDVLIVNGVWQFGSLATRHILRGSPTPYFVFTHGMLDPWFKRTYPLKHIKKSLYWRWGEYRVLRDARAVLFTCEEERLLARESFRPYKCNEAVVNYGTAAPQGNPAQQRSAFLEQFPDLNGKRILLYLSRIHPKKGCNLLLEAFACVAESDPALHLVMAGPDQMGWQKTLQQQANQLGISQRVTWTGMLSGDLKWGAYHAAEVFVLPSHQENFGIVVAEALACGKPVLISNKVNIWREIEHVGAGFVANDDLEGTRALFKQWLATSLEKRIEMAVQAVACFQNHFEIHRAAQSLMDVICGATICPKVE